MLRLDREGQARPDGNGPGRDWVIDCAVPPPIYSSLNQALIAITP